MKFSTQADFWVGSCAPVLVDVAVENKGGKVLVDCPTQGISTQEVKMSYNGIQLRFDLVRNQGKFIVFSDRHSPPKPLAQMYKDLGGR